MWPVVCEYLHTSASVCLLRRQRKTDELASNSEMLDLKNATQDVSPHTRVHACAVRNVHATNNTHTHSIYKRYICIHIHMHTYICTHIHTHIQDTCISIVCKYVCMRVKRLSVSFPDTSIPQGDLSPRRLAELTNALEAAELQHILVRVPLFATLREEQVQQVARFSFMYWGCIFFHSLLFCMLSSEHAASLQNMFSHQVLT